MSMYQHGKNEKLCSNLLFNELLKTGDSFIAFPFRVVYKKYSSREGVAPITLAISVGKRKFKHAVDRNRVKRLTREAYRLNKMSLWNLLKEDESMDVLLVFLSDELPSYNRVNVGITKMIGKFKKLAEKTN